MRTDHIRRNTKSNSASAKAITSKVFAGLVLTVSIALVSGPAQEQPRRVAAAANAVRATRVQTALHIVQQDMLIADVLQSLRNEATRGLVTFRNVRVVDPATETVLA